MNTDYQIMDKDANSKMLDQRLSFLIENLLNHIVFVGDHNFLFAVPEDIPPGLKRNIIVAVKAYYGGYRSIDYVLKTYGAQWPEDEPDKDNVNALLDDLLYQGLREVDNVCDWWTEVNKVNGTAGLIAAGAALLRLKTSFQVALFLIRLGNVHEASCICRLILEQIAWAYRVHDISDQEEPINIPTKKSISHLNKLFPSVGQLYGLLSAYTHLSDEDARSYILSEEHDFTVVRRTNEHRGFLGFIYLQLVDRYCVVSEYVHRHHVQKARSLRQDESGAYKIADDRPVAKLLELCNMILTKTNRSHDQPQKNRPPAPNRRHRPTD